MRSTRSTRAKQTRNSTSKKPSAAYYVGYVEDEESVEMIMKKFEELEKLKQEMAATQNSPSPAPAEQSQPQAQPTENESTADSNATNGAVDNTSAATTAAVAAASAAVESAANGSNTSGAEVSATNESSVTTTDGADLLEKLFERTSYVRLETLAQNKPRMVKCDVHGFVASEEELEDEILEYLGDGDIRRIRCGAYGSSDDDFRRRHSDDEDEEFFLDGTDAFSDEDHTSDLDREDLNELFGGDGSSGSGSGIHFTDSSDDALLGKRKRRSGIVIRRSAGKNKKQNIHYVDQFGDAFVMKKKIRLEDPLEVQNVKIPDLPISRSWAKTIHPLPFQKPHNWPPHNQSKTKVKKEVKAEDAVTDEEREQHPLTMVLSPSKSGHIVAFTSSHIHYVDAPSRTLVYTYTPYRVPPDENTTYIEVDDILKTNLPKLVHKMRTAQKRKFEAVLLDPPYSSIRFPALRDLLMKGVAPLIDRGYIFIWIEKEFIQYVVNTMRRMEFEYVENMAWIRQDTNNKFAMGSYQFFQRSKLTLFIFRKKNDETKKMDLRHQRNPDVILDFIHTTKNKKPDFTYEVVETLLPSAAKTGKCLELWALPGQRRRGWLQLVETRQRHNRSLNIAAATDIKAEDDSGDDEDGDDNEGDEDGDEETVDDAEVEDNH